jgi:hypothetical protein
MRVITMLMVMIYLRVLFAVTAVAMAIEIVLMHNTPDLTQNYINTSI